MHLRNGNLLTIVAAIITIGCITVSAQPLTTLHSFNGGDGRSPEATLVQGSDGNFYGTTPLGGAHAKGTVFKIDSTGSLTTLHSFSGFPADGAVPVAGLVQGTDGNFYGTTTSGGAFYQGTMRAPCSTSEAVSAAMSAAESSHRRKSRQRRKSSPRGARRNPPRLVADDSVRLDTPILLVGFNRGFGLRPKITIHSARISRRR